MTKATQHNTSSTAIFHENPVKVVPECLHSGFYWGYGGGGDNWSYKVRKAPFKSSPPTNQFPTFSRRMPFLSPNH